MDKERWKIMTKNGIRKQKYYSENSQELQETTDDTLRSQLSEIKIRMLKIKQRKITVVVSKTLRSELILCSMLEARHTYSDNKKTYTGKATFIHHCA